MDQDYMFLIGDTAENLGLTQEQLLGMGIKEFYHHCTERGMEPIFSMDGVAPGLTLDFSSDKAISPNPSEQPPTTPLK